MLTSSSVVCLTIQLHSLQWGAVAVGNSYWEPPAIPPNFVIYARRVPYRVKVQNEHCAHPVRLSALVSARPASPAERGAATATSTAVPNTTAMPSSSSRTDSQRLMH